MKKKLAILLATVMSLSVLSACGAASSTASSTAASTAASTASSAASSEAEVVFLPDEFQVKAIDDTTLEVTLVAPTPYFLELTAFPAYMPVQEATVEANAEAWATEASTYIGNGAYKVVEWVPSSHILMEKNEAYWNAANLAGPKQIKFALIEDDASQLTAFKAKELDFVDAIPQDEIDAMKKTPEYNQMGQIGTYYVSYNVNAAPFDNALVRQAFTLAVDRDFICEQVGKAGQVPAGAYVPDSLSDTTAEVKFRDIGGDYYDPTLAANDANLAKAKELLKEAGFEDGKGLPTVTYLYNEGTGHQAIGEALQASWQRLGVTVTLESQEWNTFLNTRKNHEYQVARNGWLGDYNDPISFLDMWITDGGNNDAGWSNKDYDKYITSIKNSGDVAERMTMMHEAEDLLFDEWVLCPIYYYVDVYMQSAELKDVLASPLGFKHFQNATNGKDVLNVCIGPDPDTIDPALNSAVDGGTLINHAFEGLYSLDAAGVPVPAQAESVEISEDNLTYTFHLRDGLTWADGTPLTAKDFVYSWQRAINPETGADYAYMYESIKGYTEALGG